MAVKRDMIFTGIALLLVGLLFLIAPITTTRVIYGAIGLVFAIAGAIRLFFAIRVMEAGILKTQTIVVSILLLLLGIFFLVNPEFLVLYNYIIFGLIMIVNGLVNIFGVIKGEIYTSGNKVLHIVLSVLLVIIGIIVLAHPFSTAAMLTIMIGVFLLVSGIVNIVSALFIR
ncbi:MAG: DUF308 domain-containing protein [Lachnospiraceae bacterium]|nr:DUF308 domain-containing protein [Lachnospiraceae bacterium]